MNAPNTNKLSSEPVLLSPLQMAELSDGTWKNYPSEGLNILELRFTPAEIKPGDLFFFNDHKSKAAAGKAQKIIDQAIAKGAVALVVSKDVSLDCDLPLLLVDDPKEALRRIGCRAGQRSSARKVLVTGSAGKTGVKFQLHHLCKEQINTYAALDSTNQDCPIHRALGSIRQSDELAIIEVAVPRPGVGERRSAWVEPDICVITSIGPIHMDSHGGTIADVIRNKAKVVLGMKPGGAVVLPAGRSYSEALMKEVASHGVDNIYLVGEEEDNFAQIIRKRLGNQGWDIVARVGDQELDYSIPMLEDYAPQSSLMALSVAKLLGLDIERCVKCYSTFRQFRSSGNLFRLSGPRGSFLLYDQSIRGHLLGFEGMLRTMAGIQPEKAGRKIAVLSEFLNLDRASRDSLKVEYVRSLMDDAEIDALFTVGRFPEHMEVVTDKSIWLGHRNDPTELLDPLMNQISEGDLVFIRARKDLRADRLVNALIRSCDPVEQVY